MSARPTRRGGWTAQRRGTAGLSGGAARHDPEEVDAYFSQLAARLKRGRRPVRQGRAGTGRAPGRGQPSARAPSFEQVGGEAAALLQAGRSAEQLVENGRRRADTIIEKAQQQAEQLRDEVTAEAQRVLSRLGRWPSRSAAEVEAERAAVVEETDQVREFRDGLLDDLGRVHGEISGLLERTRMQRDQALDAGDAAAKAVPNGKAKQPAEPAKVAEDQ